MQCRADFVKAETHRPLPPTPDFTIHEADAQGFEEAASRARPRQQQFIPTAAKSSSHPGGLRYATLAPGSAERIIHPPSDSFLSCRGSSEGSRARRRGGEGPTDSLASLLHIFSGHR